MPISASIVKTTDGTFIPCTAYDAELLGSLKAGKPYKVEIKRGSDRSYQHHKLFFGGLLPLAYEYWQPTGGLTGKVERDTVNWVIRDLCRQSGADESVLLGYAEDSLRRLAEKRADKYGAAALSLEAFRKELTIQAGYYDVYETPWGVRKEAKSISFASMSQEEFYTFYQNCFQVAWNMMLAAVFDSEESAQQAAVQKMMEFGR